MPGGRFGSPGLPPTAPSRIASCRGSRRARSRAAPRRWRGSARRRGRSGSARTSRPAGRRDLEDLEGLGGHLRADAVAGDDGELDAGPPFAVSRWGHGSRLVVVGRWPPLSRRSSEAWTPPRSPGCVGFSGCGLAGPQSGYMSYIGRARRREWWSGTPGRTPRDGAVRPWIARGGDLAEMRIALVGGPPRGDLAAEMSSVAEKAATPNTAARWPLCQASPRRSMSTNTLRMVYSPYGRVGSRPISRLFTCETAVRNGRLDP
jgi:hypothetical protein